MEEGGKVPPEFQDRKEREVFLTQEVQASREQKEKEETQVK